MADAVIVSTARTPLCKSWRGALNMTHGAKMGGHVVHAALERAKVEPQEVEDVIMGCATPEGATGGNIARQIALRASDIDMVYLTGYGFPAYRGGPMFYADTVGLKNVLNSIQKFQSGYKGEVWKPAPLLVKLANEGRKFNG